MEKPAYWSINKIFVNNKTQNRMMIVFRTPPCQKIIQGERCFICGFDCHCKNIRGYNIASQFRFLKKIIEQNKIERVDILSSGSLLDEKQIDYKQVLKLMEEIKKLKDVRSVLIEGRAEYCNLDKLKRIKEVLNKNTELEYGIGLESYSSYVRNAILKKDLSTKDYMQCIKKLAEIDVAACTYILAGIPGLPLKDSLKETISSIFKVINFYKKHGYKGRIALFPIFIAPGTQLEDLYNQGKYNLITLGSIIDILSEIKNKVDFKKHPIFIGLDDENISRGRHILSRDKDEKILKLIQKFNCTQEI
ncbi:MAG: hypothetical protein Q8N21_01320 [bacterium]|nr:hypothetical protein [bacterium]